MENLKSGYCQFQSCPSFFYATPTLDPCLSLRFINPLDPSIPKAVAALFIHSTTIFVRIISAWCHWFDHWVHHDAPKSTTLRRPAEKAYFVASCRHQLGWIWFFTNGCSPLWRCTRSHLLTILKFRGSQRSQLRATLQVCLCNKDARGWTWWPKTAFLIKQTSFWVLIKKRLRGIYANNIYDMLIIDVHWFLLQLD